MSEKNEILVDRKDLLKDEQVLVDRGELEIPVLDNYIIADN